MKIHNTNRSRLLDYIIDFYNTELDTNGRALNKFMSAMENVDLI